MKASSTQTVLITGASGFIGNRIYKDLALSGYNVIEIGRSAAFDSSKFIKWDLSENVQICLSKLSGLNVMYLVHCAGAPHTNVDERTDKSMVNGIGIKILLDQLIQGKHKPRVIFLSSVSVYGRDRGVNISRDDITIPVDQYGVAKLEAESCILKYGADNGVEVSCLRLPLVVGVNAPGSLRKMVDAISAGKMVLPKKVISEKSWISRTDVSSFIIYLIDKNFVAGAYNLTSGTNFVFNDFVEKVSIALSEKAPKKVPIKLLLIAAKVCDAVNGFGIRTPLSTSVLNKMISTLTFRNDASDLSDWSPSVSLESAVSELAESE